MGQLIFAPERRAFGVVDRRATLVAVVSAPKTMTHWNSVRSFRVWRVMPPRHHSVRWCVKDGGGHREKTYGQRVTVISSEQFVKSS